MAMKQCMNFLKAWAIREKNPSWIASGDLSEFEFSFDSIIRLYIRDSTSGAGHTVCLWKYEFWSEKEVADPFCKFILIPSQTNVILLKPYFLQYNLLPEYKQALSNLILQRSTLEDLWL